LDFYVHNTFQIKREKSAKRKELREQAQREEKERVERDRLMAAEAKGSRAVTTTTVRLGLAGKSAHPDKRHP
jgi:hypothetical protein